MGKNRRYSQTVHHVVPSSRRDEGFNPGLRVNLRDLRKTYHENWHRLFANKIPSEIVDAVVQVQHNVIRPQVRRVIEALCDLPKRDFYVTEILTEYADEDFDPMDVELVRGELKRRIQELLEWLSGDASNECPEDKNP
jgi:hypothetical protein